MFRKGNIPELMEVLIETLWNVKTYETTGGYLKVLY